MSGHKHLYLIESEPPPPVGDNDVTVPTAKYTTRSITQGNWSVLESKVRIAIFVAFVCAANILPLRFG